MGNLFAGVYKGRRVLVTGHTGFKGSWLTLWLKELGAEVTGLSLGYPTTPSLFKSLGLEDKVNHLLGDIRNYDNLLQVFKEHKPEIVFHLAAQPLVRLSYREPKLTYETNIIGTVNVLETIRNTTGVNVLINVTSDKCYENKEWVYGFRETDRIGGSDPYSSSKGCAELITSAYRDSFFDSRSYGTTHCLRIASARAGNVIGGGDFAEDRIIPDCIRSLERGETIFIRNPEATRPWQHVLEPISGYLWLGSRLWEGKEDYSGAWNFGPKSEKIVTVNELVERVIYYWGSGKFERTVDSKFHEKTYLKLDISKAISILKWQPLYNVEEAIEKTTSWYRYFFKERNLSMYEYTLNQLREYIAKAVNLSGIEWSRY